jgi:23S rRNA (uracil1939-C5)-methyltransferase
MEKILTIEKLVHGGQGLCRTDSGVVFVSGVIPGEKIRASIAPSGGKLLIAECLEILEPSRSRRQPPCALAGICGGCNWLHIEYPKQVSIKEEIFRECLLRIGKIAVVPNIAIYTSPELGYRRRVQIKIDHLKGIAGFYKQKSNEVISIARCPLLCDSLNHFLSQLPKHFSTFSKLTEQIKAIAGTPQETLHVAARYSPEVASWPIVQGLSVGRTEIQVESFRFSVAGDGFFQSNIFLCGPLGKLSTEGLKGDFFWDLYGGAGFFSVFVANGFSRGTLVDNEQSHVTEAEKNLKENGIKNVSAVAQTAAGFIEKQCRDLAKNKPHLIIVDPPRTGLDETVRLGIAKILPSLVLYVSCDPATQARDAGFFINKCGYHIEKASLFDFYPHTHHMETVLLLRR